MMAGRRQAPAGAAPFWVALLSWRRLFLLLSVILVLWAGLSRKEYRREIEALQAHFSAIGHAPEVIHVDGRLAEGEAGESKLRGNTPGPETETEGEADGGLSDVSARGQEEEEEWWTDGLHPRIYVYDDLPAMFREPCMWCGRYIIAHLYAQREGPASPALACRISSFASSVVVPGT